jgi:hypothetical protein
MSIAADALRAFLIPFLVATGTLLLLLVGHVLSLHSFRSLVSRRRQQLQVRYEPLIAAALQAGDPATTLDALRSVPRRHRQLVQELLLKPLENVRGSVVGHAQAAAGVLGLIPQWKTDLRDRRWPTRADAVHALGLVRDRTATTMLIRALDDPIEEVRAAAVEALGRIGDPAALPELVARLSDAGRYQHVRLVEALQQFGAHAVAPVLEHVREHPEDRAAIAQLLGNLEASGAVGTLLEWCGDERAEVRTAAVRAVGAIGADDRAYYHLLRALGDEAAEVRAAAAWALGRAGREEAAPYLAPRLQDEWIVAAQSARALRGLGRPGRLALESAAALEQGELARQMLWEFDAATTGA